MKNTLLSCLLLIAIAAGAADPTPIEKSIASPERTAADRERDQRDKPAEVMAFAGVKPGMVIADIFAAGGYYTELLAGVVGPSGKVLAINNLPYAAFSKDAHQGALHRGEARQCRAPHRRSQLHEYPAAERGPRGHRDGLPRRVLDR